ncbi:MAG: serine/threonine protein kinase, partial [Myxococcales bacterium]|nr:serine/threonine protein kinase [Myxococcales bacterium]
MGTVYEALDELLGRRVAIKSLRWRPGHGTDGDRAIRRFLREGQVAAQVRHAHVVAVYDSGVDAAGVPFLVMELVEGESLAQLLSGEKRLSLERTSEILLPVLSAVAELHAAGIVHRDIKPANILLTAGRDACPKLADFGVSRFEDSPTITHPGATIGTPEYMAPEVICSGKPATPRSDQYAIGVILY